MGDGDAPALATEDHMSELGDRLRAAGAVRRQGIDHPDRALLLEAAARVDGLEAALETKAILLYQAQSRLLRRSPGTGN